MYSLKQQLLLLVLGPLILLSILGSAMTAVYMKDRTEFAAEIKANSDLATGEEIINLMYPEPWEVRDGALYKGKVKINNNPVPVDKIAALTGDTVTIFLGDSRVSTTVRYNGERAIGTKVSEEVANKVLRNGQVFLGQANVIGEIYQTAYKPIRDSSGKIVGMLYVGISKKLSDELVRDSLLTNVLLSSILTLFMALGAWFFTQRAIIGPLKQITEGTREIAIGHNYGKVEVPGSNEIGELANAFNQMVEGMQGFALHITKVAGNDGRDDERVLPTKPVPSPIENKNPVIVVEEELPKGFNESTLKQLLAFMESRNIPMSAEEIGEGVNLTRVTARRYLDYLEKIARVEAELKYGTIGRPVKLYRIN